MKHKSSVADPFHFDIDPDPFREITDPDPAPNQQKNINFCFTFFPYKNTFRRNMICFVIYGV